MVWKFFLCLTTAFFALSGFLWATQRDNKKIIGRSEMVCLSQWGVRLQAKIDTGAYLCSLHVSDIEMKEKPKRVRFRTVDHQGKTYTLEAPLEKYVRVKSSFGQVQKRPAIRIRLCLAGQEIEALVSLDDRSDMRFPMLIGRKILKGRFLVDPALVRLKEDACCPASPASHFP